MAKFKDNLREERPKQKQKPPNTHGPVEKLLAFLLQIYRCFLSTLLGTCTIFVINVFTYYLGTRYCMSLKRHFLLWVRHHVANDLAMVREEAPWLPAFCTVLINDKLSFYEIFINVSEWYVFCTLLYTGMKVMMPPIVRAIFKWLKIFFILVVGKRLESAIDDILQTLAAIMRIYLGRNNLVLQIAKKIKRTLKKFKDIVMKLFYVVYIVLHIVIEGVMAFMSGALMQ